MLWNAQNLIKFGSLSPPRGNCFSPQAADRRITNDWTKHNVSTWDIYHSSSQNSESSWKSTGELEWYCTHSLVFAALLQRNAAMCIHLRCGELEKLLAAPMPALSTCPLIPGASSVLTAPLGLPVLWVVPCPAGGKQKQLEKKKILSFEVIFSENSTKILYSRKQFNRRNNLIGEISWEGSLVDS